MGAVDRQSASASWRQLTHGVMIFNNMKKVSEEYKRLYHYTTWEGLMGILKEQTLWATHYRFLNDASEIVLIKNKLLEFISPIIRKEYQRLIKKSNEIKVAIDNSGGMEAVILHDSLSIIEAAYYATGNEIYIVSFCGEKKDDYVNNNGLLSQWRGYSAGGGVALVFNTEQLEQLLKKEAERYSYGPSFIANVIYSDDKISFEQELASSLSDFIDYVQQMFITLQGTSLEPPDASKAFPAFVQLIARYKHHAFKEEDELRIVCYVPHSHESKHEKKRKFRSKNGMLIPYIELFDSDDFVLPIEKIIIGPHKERETRAVTLQVMLRKKDIEISISDIPFIER